MHAALISLFKVGAACLLNEEASQMKITYTLVDAHHSCATPKY
jgi:hypothetical protein